jgi:hypothetical protein
MHRLFVLTIIIHYCSSINVLAQTPTAEEKSVEQFLRSETLALDSFPFNEVVRRYWLLDDKTIQCITFGDGYTRISRKDDLLVVNEEAPKQHAKVEKFNFITTVSGDVAYSYHEQKVTITDTGQVINSHEMRILKRINGQWRIHMSSVQQYTRD